LNRGKIREINFDLYSKKCPSNAYLVFIGMPCQSATSFPKQILCLLVYTANQLPVFQSKSCVYWYALPISYHFFKAKLVFIGMPCQSATSFSQENLYLLVCPANQLPVFCKKTCIYWYTPPISYQFFARKLVFIGIHRQLATSFPKQNLCLLVCSSTTIKICPQICPQIAHIQHTYNTHTTHTTHTTHIQHIKKTYGKIIKRND